MIESARAPRVLPRAEHPISRDQIEANALKVLYRLHHSGHKAYLVGGGVRDLMLGRRPKDFDVATDARPNELRRLFRNARIIGRRFRLAHILFPEGVVEVSTFRRDPTPEEQDRAAGPTDLLITSDNTWGTPEQDAYRRDFTVNALFYDIADFSVIDWVGGIEDLYGRRIRAIGNPDVRFQEDPVRMVRACEFAARLGFAIEGETQAGIERQRRELRRASAVRLAEEVVQLMRCGHAGKALQWMLDLGLLENLLPEAYAMVVAGAKGIGDLSRVVPLIDRWMGESRALSDPMLLSSLLLPGVLLRRDEIETAHKRPISRHRLQQVVEEAVGPFVARFNLSKERAAQIQQAIVAFNRMCEPGWSPAERVRFAHRPAFHDALDLFELLTEATGEGHEALASWRAAARRRAPPAHPAAPHSAHAPRAAAPAPAGVGAVRRRRRRRRPRTTART